MRPKEIDRYKDSPLINDHLKLIRAIIDWIDSIDERLDVFDERIVRLEEMFKWMSEWLLFARSKRRDLFPKKD